MTVALLAEPVPYAIPWPPPSTFSAQSRGFLRWLRTQTHRKGIRTRSELAEKIGTPASTVSRWVNEGGLPGIDNFIELSRLFGIPLLDVLEAAGYSDPVQVEEPLPPDRDAWSITFYELPLPTEERESVEEIARRTAQGFLQLRERLLAEPPAPPEGQQPPEPPSPSGSRPRRPRR